MLTITVVRFAPRYDPRLLEAARRFDDPGVPIAETCRRVGAEAELLGLTRPGYSRLREYVVEERRRVADERARREEIRRILIEAAGDLLVGRRVNAYEVADRIEDAGRRTS